MKKIILLCIIATTCLQTFSQVAEETKKEIGLITNTQKSANTKDILTSLYRAGIDNLLGNQHQFNFSTTFFGLDSIFRGSTSNGGDYERIRKLKQSSFNIGVTGDSVNNLTKISGGFTFTLINKKDIKNKRFSDEEFSSLKNKTLAIANLKKSIINNISAKLGAEFTNINKALIDSWTEADKKNDFKLLHPLMIDALKDQSVLQELADSTHISKEEAGLLAALIIKGQNPLRSLFTSIAAKYARKPLWTLSPTGNYDLVNKQGQYSLSSDFTVGLGKDLNKKPWEIEIKGLFKIQNDSTVKKTNYDSKPFSFSLGINKILVENEDKESKMEFKFFTQFDHQFGTVPAGTEKDLFTLNSTLRINVFKSLWLPLTIKYDPKNSNFLTYFSVTANIGN